MKIFLSHSSIHKPLVRELKRYLPEHVHSWIDEKDILVGDEIKTSIKDAIEIDSDFVIVFIDNNSVKSAWVIRELEWALEHEIKMERTFILPILVEKNAWNELSIDIIRTKKYLECLDFTEDSIRSLASNLISQLFALLDRELTRIKTKKSISPTKLFDDTENYFNTIADEIRSIVYQHRRSNPLLLEDLFYSLQSKPQIGIFSRDDFYSLLVRLRQQGRLAGLVFTRNSVFIEEEHYAWKTTLHVDSKKLIAEKSLDYIFSGQTIVLDAGSTTLEISRKICEGLKMQYLENISIVTNSVSAANELFKTANEMGLEDNNRIMQVYMFGGRVRPNTLAIVGNEDLKTDNTFDDASKLLKSLDGADIAFVGTNGIHQDVGFTTRSLSETLSKRIMLKWSRHKCIVTDPSKFGIKEESVFAEFDEDIEILTVKEDTLPYIDFYEKFFKDTPVRLTYA